jgi:hypothetical protein
MQGFELETHKNKNTLFTTALLLACVNFVGVIFVMKRAKIGSTILGTLKLLHGPGLNLWQTEIVITPAT